MKRNAEIEKRIKDREEYDRQHNTNSYGGMGLDSSTPSERIKKLEDIKYMNQFINRTR